MYIKLTIATPDHTFQPFTILAGRASFKRVRVCSTDAPDRSDCIVKK
jgi:hypothetical protein